MSSRIPHLLEPYLTVPPAAAAASSSLRLVTSVLGASANWLLLRHVYAALRGSDNDNANDTGVVLVSFLRDASFWRDGAARLGLDLDALARAGRVVVVDGLTGLFAAHQASPAARGERELRSANLLDVRQGLEGAVADLKTSRKVLVVDALDVLLAATDEDVTSLAIQSLLLSLRSANPGLTNGCLQLVHSTVLALSADAPLVASQATTLEREHASLVLSLAHAADGVQALRLLDTGTARDVSGVVRITGPEVEDDGDKEFLYHVAADASVKVFERGT